GATGHTGSHTVDELLANTTHRGRSSLGIYRKRLRERERNKNNETESTTTQERDHEQAGREETGNEDTHGCHRPRRQGSGCFCARRESRWDAHPWPRRARLPLECE